MKASKSFYKIKEAACFQNCSSEKRIELKTCKIILENRYIFSGFTDAMM